MTIILVAVGLLCVFGTLSLVLQRSPRGSNALGAAGALLSCAVGVSPAVSTLWSGRVETFRSAWNVPFGSFSVQIDALSAVFLIPIFILCGMAALYGSGAMMAYRSRKNLGAFWFFFNLLTASMVMVAIAANGLLFLVCWEIMALSSFFLVTFENEQETVRRAGWTYLVATHLGTAFLLVLFLVLGNQAGGASLDFDGILAAGPPMASTASLAFLLAVVGFGAKAGFIPFHVWLPEAHPAAPSHVSAVMSGVMIKTGIYGLLRTLCFLGTPPPWWGLLLIGIGLVSGILGVLFALAQHDLKRLLAYHSVENIGIIALGLGLGLLGVAVNAPALAVLGLAGALLHVINHALFKGLLFLGAGTVLHATGTREIDRLGGLIKRMPWTAGTFLVGAVAISGLPPLNGFISEFLIYFGAFRSVGASGTAAAGAGVIIGLALIGGLAAACFTKAFGIVFLGEPRSEAALDVHEAGWTERAPMLILAAGCVAIGAFAPHAASVMGHAVAIVTGFAPVAVETQLSSVRELLSGVVLIAGLFIAMIVLLAWARFRMLSSRAVEESCTWDCGYTRPSASMQYTASSFAQPLTKMFETFLRPTTKCEKPDELFPIHASFHSETEDLFGQKLYRPIFLGIERLVLTLRFLQAGRVQLYILYIGLTLLLLLIWNLR
ncbi:MAG: proton-conducting transporter membrane subunit [Syntrophobacteraceae bacterium]